jgi:hypothetical protein
VASVGAFDWLLPPAADAAACCPLFCPVEALAELLPPLPAAAASVAAPKAQESARHEAKQPTLIDTLRSHCFVIFVSLSADEEDEAVETRLAEASTQRAKERAVIEVLVRATPIKIPRASAPIAEKKNSWHVTTKPENGNSRQVHRMDQASW